MAIHWPFDVSISSWHVFTNISNQKCIKSLEKKKNIFILLFSIRPQPNGCGMELVFSFIQSKGVHMIGSPENRIKEVKRLQQVSL